MQTSPNISTSNIDPEIQKKFEEINTKLDAIFKSTERTRKIFTWTLILSVVMFVLPLIGLMFAIPTFFSLMKSYIPTGL